MNRIRFFWVMLLLASCTKDIETTHPQIEPISELVYAAGTIKSRDQYQVHSTVNGVINDIKVAEGDLVKKGEVLMVVRNEPSQLNVQNAKLAAAHADIKANSSKLKEARVSIELAHAKLRDDSLLLVRQRNLKSKGVGTLVELEQRELAYKNAVTNYELALLNYRELERDLMFSYEQSKTNLKISESLGNDYFIRAESDGKVYKVLRERGEFASTLSPVAIIGNADDFIIELNVDEYDISRVHVGQEILVSMDSYKGQVFKGRIEIIEPLMDEQSRSFIVRAAFIDRPKELYPNLTVEANIVIRSNQKALTIPRSYLIGDSLVMVGKHETRKVAVGIMDYRKAEILSGLTEADLIYKISP
jgi:multidrug efflux pump subunit AcrA (membrane-fusion protein)